MEGPALPLSLDQHGCGVRAVMSDHDQTSVTYALILLGKIREDSFHHPCTMTAIGVLRA